MAVPLLVAQPRTVVGMPSAPRVLPVRSVRAAGLATVVAGAPVVASPVVGTSEVIKESNEKLREQIKEYRKQLDVLEESKQLREELAELIARIAAYGAVRTDKEAMQQLKKELDEAHKKYGEVREHQKLTQELEDVRTQIARTVRGESSAEPVRRPGPVNVVPYMPTPKGVSEMVVSPAGPGGQVTRTVTRLAPMIYY
eukprot:TRINITY_DN54322_c0_g1_i1.p1 TRINITY_DN54322_c0_g1~~TRINITY_DN54322_c0_g1_i1.p1  ORF type:complete len:213 (-),score=44.70 TRINITY_DN54322_c0_g1_i1:112-705(-)